MGTPARRLPKSCIAEDHRFTGGGIRDTRNWRVSWKKAPAILRAYLREDEIKKGSKEGQRRPIKAYDGILQAIRVCDTITLAERIEESLKGENPGGLFSVKR